MAHYSAFVIITAKFDTTGYFPSDLVYERPLIHPVDIPLNFNCFDDMTEVTEYALAVTEWLETARAIALQIVNSTHDAVAPRLNTVRLVTPFFIKNDLVLE